MNNLFMGQVFALRYDIRSNRVKSSHSKNLILIIKVFKTISRADWNLGLMVDTYLVMCAKKGTDSVTGVKK